LTKSKLKLTHIYTMDKKTVTGLSIALLIMTVMAVTFGYLYYQERALTNQQEQDLEARVSDGGKA
jgi:cell division protein FtsL